MKYPYSIDLHMHTTVSDGTDTPEEILVSVKEAGIELFSVTDHDSLNGGKAIMNMLTETDPRFIPGVEFSCKDEEGKYHILGYGYDPDSEGIREIVEMGHQYRMDKVQSRMEMLEKEYGFTFPEEEVRKLMESETPGKPHIGNLMVKYGFAETKEQAIKQYINHIRIHSEYVRPEEAISGILESGGIPVLAHPSYGNGDQFIIGDDMDRRLRRLMDYGLRGVEAFYSGFTERLRAEMLAFAEKYGLYVTAGSDYHGKNKLVVLGDTGLKGAPQLPDGLCRFLDEIQDHMTN